MKTPKINPFIKKLYEILKNVEYNDIIRWEDNSCFIILDKDKLSEIVLRSNFKTTSYSSFIRQLNKYGFRKLRKENIFRNENFIRDQVTLLGNIKIKDNMNTFSEIKNNSISINLFNIKVLKALRCINSILDKLSKGYVFKDTDNMRILMFENFDTSEILTGLEKKGMEVEQVFFYNDFEKKMLKRTYDYLVIDSSLYELFKQVSMRENIKFKTKIIITEDKENFKNWRNDRILRKPYTLEELLKYL